MDQDDRRPLPAIRRSRGVRAGLSPTPRTAPRTLTLAKALRGPARADSRPGLVTLATAYLRRPARKARNLISRSSSASPPTWRPRRCPPRRHRAPPTQRQCQADPIRRQSLCSVPQAPATHRSRGAGNPRRPASGSWPRGPRARFAEAVISCSASPGAWRPAACCGDSPSSGGVRERSALPGVGARPRSAPQVHRARGCGPPSPAPRAGPAASAPPVRPVSGVAPGDDRGSSSRAPRLDRGGDERPARRPPAPAPANVPRLSAGSVPLLGQASASSSTRDSERPCSHRGRARPARQPT